MAAVVDSNTSARMLGRSRPPEWPAPGLRRRKSPPCSALENPHRLRSQTRPARVLVSWPSGSWGKCSNRYSAVTKPSTESPKNYRRS